MSEPFTIRFFVPDGKPHNILIINRLNWTGEGIKFAREYWLDAGRRPEFSKAGIYMLIGDQEIDPANGLPLPPRLYIGQAENLRNRITEHYKQKDFWEWAVVFISSNDSLNRAHLIWLEHILIQKAKGNHRSQLLSLENNQNPNEPNLSQSDKADMQTFLKEILQILPLINLHVFEDSKSMAPVSCPEQEINEVDTIIVPAQEEGFKKVFLGQNSWWSVRIASHMKKKLRFIAAYQTSPISAITHYAPIKLIEDFGNEGKYKIIFSEKATEIKKIPLGRDAPKGTMQSARYTTLAKLKKAKTIMEL